MHIDMYLTSKRYALYIQKKTRALTCTLHPKRDVLYSKKDLRFDLWFTAKKDMHFTAKKKRTLQQKDLRFDMYFTAKRDVLYSKKDLLFDLCCTAPQKEMYFT